MAGARWTVAVVLFEGFELLDVFGPVELLSFLPSDYEITYHADEPGAVRSGQGARVLAPLPLEGAADIVVVPGGPGTRRLVGDRAFLDVFAPWAARAPVVASVCTGSAVLAAAGLLEGYRATSNKRSFAWASGFGSDVEWVPRARWVHDRDRWTSSGVAAGMDMAHALIAHFSGPDAAAEAARAAELEVRTDPHWDPFADAHHPG